MPNWCSNRWVISGPQNLLEELENALRGSGVAWENKDLQREALDLDFNQIVPVPEEILRRGYDSTGYNWCIQHWGTKWNAGYAHVTSNEDSLVYDFDTAWAPAYPVAVALAEKFPQLLIEFEYKEPGMGFSGEGYLHFEKNVEVHNEYEGSQVCQFCASKLEKGSCSLPCDASLEVEN